jgi:hypothetical protein
MSFSWLAPPDRSRSGDSVVRGPAVRGRAGSARLTARAPGEAEVQDHRRSPVTITLPGFEIAVTSPWAWMAASPAAASLAILRNSSAV